MDTPVQITAQLYQYGVLGIFTIILLYLSYALLKREQNKSDQYYAENERKDLEIQRLNTVIQDKIVPAIIAATSVITASQAVLQTIQYQRDIEQALKKDKPNAV